MKLAEMVAKLQEMEDKLGGDVEVLITDGHNAACYRGDYEIIAWREDDGTLAVDIGIGGCLE